MSKLAYTFWTSSFSSNASTRASTARAVFSSVMGRGDRHLGHFCGLHFDVFGLERFMNGLKLVRIRDDFVSCPPA